MRNVYGFLLLGFFMLVFSACLSGGGVSVSPTPNPDDTLEVGLNTGNRAPDFSIEEGFNFGEVILPSRLSDFRGKVVLVNFWASWCGPCKIEMPSLESLWERYQGDGFVLLGVNRTNTESRDDARGYMESEGFTFPTVFDPRGKIALTYSVHSIPTSYIVDKHGVIREVVIGAIDWDTDQVYGIIDQLLGE